MESTNMLITSAWLVLIVSALPSLVHAGHPNETSVLGQRQLIHVTRRQEGESADQLRISEPISNSNNTLVINTNYSPTPWLTPEADTRHQVSSSTSSSVGQLGNDTISSSEGGDAGFPFNAHESLRDGQSDGDGLPPGVFYMLNATCNENEDPDCIIDHNITCVGDPLHCNLTYEEYLEMLYDYIYPSVPEWILICSHAVVFLMGLVGNALVCIAVYTNHSMRTVTNIFIVNLAVADFFVILFCLPPTVLWDVTETWFMGRSMCKGLIYFQTVSVTVSVLTLTFISLDRWYAICFPLRYVSTNERAIGSIAFIWIVALLSDIPELLALTTKEPKFVRYGVKLFTQCATNWDKETEKHFYITRSVILYILPLLLMTVSYFQIVRVLWKSDTIPGHRESRNHQQYTCSYLRNPCPPANSSTMGQLRTRRKAAKMLVAVVIMFAGCFFPVHCLNIVRYTIDIGQDQVVTVLSLLSHWLCYANSAINPVIYNFMSGKFRREFKHALEKCRCGSTNRGRVEDRSMYHSAPATRFNNISPSSRSNYQLQSMRDFTRQQTLQTSFIENNHQRTLQQSQSRGAALGHTVNGNGHGNGLEFNGNGAGDLLRQNSNPYLRERGTVTQSPNGAEPGRETKGNGSGNNNSSQCGPP